MNKHKIARILYSMSLGLDYADGIEDAEEEIEYIVRDLEDIGDSLLQVLESIALDNEKMENFYKKIKQTGGNGTWKKLY